MQLSDPPTGYSGDLYDEQVHLTFWHHPNAGFIHNPLTQKMESGEGRCCPLI